MAGGGGRADLVVGALAQVGELLVGVVEQAAEAGAQHDRDLRARARRAQGGRPPYPYACAQAPARARACQPPACAPHAGQRLRCQAPQSALRHRGGPVPRKRTPLTTRSTQLAPPIGPCSPTAAAVQGSAMAGTRSGDKKGRRRAVRARARLADEDLVVLLELVLRLLVLGRIGRARDHALGDVHVERRRIPAAGGQRSRAACHGCNLAASPAGAARGRQPGAPEPARQPYVRAWCGWRCLSDGAAQSEPGNAGARGAGRGGAGQRTSGCAAAPRWGTCPRSRRRPPSSSAC